MKRSAGGDERGGGGGRREGKMWLVGWRRRRGGSSERGKPCIVCVEGGRVEEVEVEGGKRITQK